MKHTRLHAAVLTGLAALVLAGAGALVAPSASAHTPAAHTTSAETAAAQSTPRGSHLSGTTAVLTAPGIAGTLVQAGVIPLPVKPASVKAGFDHGFALTYGFPVTGGNPDLDRGKGHILHSGGIDFVGLGGDTLEIGKFDIDLAAGKIFAREVNFEAARIPVLDLDLSELRVSMRHGATVLSNIELYLDPVAADALNTTFDLGLPEDGSLLFGKGKVTLRG